MLCEKQAFPIDEIVVPPKPTIVSCMHRAERVTITHAAYDDGDGVNGPQGRAKLHR